MKAWPATHGVNLSVHPVTALANSTSAAPVWPAGYAERQAYKRGVMRPSWKWYGVKTLHRTMAKGRPIATDSLYSRTMTLVEERVVILKARNFDEAIKRAEVEARVYSRSCRHRNRYGQHVRSRYLGL